MQLFERLNLHSANGAKAISHPQLDSLFAYSPTGTHGLKLDCGCIAIGLDIAILVLRLTGLPSSFNTSSHLSIVSTAGAPEIIILDFGLAVSTSTIASNASLTSSECVFDPPHPMITLSSLTRLFAWNKVKSIAFGTMILSVSSSNPLLAAACNPFVLTVSMCASLAQSLKPDFI